MGSAAAAQHPGTMGKPCVQTKCAWHTCCWNVLIPTHQHPKAAPLPQEGWPARRPEAMPAALLAASCCSRSQTADPILPLGLASRPTSSGVLASMTSRSRASARYSSLRRLLLLILRSSSRRSLSLITRRGACSRPRSVSACNRHRQGHRLLAQTMGAWQGRVQPCPHVLM